MTASIRLHGIPNCDTVKRARVWLTEQGLAHEFVDFKKAGASAADLGRWSAAVGWEKLLNRQGTTWRKLDAAAQAQAADAAGAERLMQAQVSVIKRPVVDWPDGVTTIGFSPRGLGNPGRSARAGRGRANGQVVTRRKLRLP